ncbi:MAG: HAD hydrolase-like protein [Candidatus Acidiferrum sp.]
MNEQRRRYILLDRDGVINRRTSNGCAKNWETFEFIPRALEAMRMLAWNDFVGIVISRQTCGGRGAQTASELDAITRRLLMEVALSEGNIARVYYCRHGSEDGCHCYEPGKGLIARAQADYGFPTEKTFFISESESDLDMAAAAGCSCIRIQRDAFLQPRRMEGEPYRVASSLYEAAGQIVALGEVRGRAYAAL